MYIIHIKTYIVKINFFNISMVRYTKKIHLGSSIVQFMLPLENQMILLLSTNVFASWHYF